MYLTFHRKTHGGNEVTYKLQSRVYDFIAQQNCMKTQIQYLPHMERTLSNENYLFRKRETKAIVIKEGLFLKVFIGMNYCTTEL